MKSLCTQFSGGSCGSFRRLGWIREGFEESAIAMLLDGIESLVQLIRTQNLIYNRPNGTALFNLTLDIEPLAGWINESNEISPDTGPSALQLFLFRQTANYENKTRQDQFFEKMTDDPHTLRLIAEGDSWFCYPIVNPYDLAAYLGATMPVLSFARPADKVENLIERQNQVSAAIREYGVLGLVISIGGNEVLTEILNRSLVSNGANFEIAYRQLDREMSQIMGGIDRYVSFMFRENSQIHIFIHGYSYAKPRSMNANSWVTSVFLSKNIPVQYWDEIVKEYVNKYNEKLIELSNRYDRLHFVDLRELQENDPDRAFWHDEIHLSSRGFERAAGQFLRAFKRVYG